jgi:hypothetical protein
MIVQVTPDQAAKMWGALAPLFERVTCHTNGCYEPTDVLREILNGQQTLWVSWREETGVLEAAMTTAIITYPRRRTCKVIYIAGEHMNRWRDEFIEVVERYAREHGATAMEGGFRRGWARIAGYQETGVSLFKELST